MAEQFYPIKSVKTYFKEYGVEAIGKKKQAKDLVRAQLLDAFKHEIFNQFMVMLGDPQLLAKDINDIDPETRRKADNILSNSVRKWKRLCVVFQQYRETANCIFPSDLMVDLEEVVKAIVEGEPEDAHLDAVPSEGATTDDNNPDTEPGESPGSGGHA